MLQSRCSTRRLDTWGLHKARLTGEGDEQTKESQHHTSTHGQCKTPPYSLLRHQLPSCKCRPCHCSCRCSGWVDHNPSIQQTYQLWQQERGTLDSRTRHATYAHMYQYAKIPKINPASSVNKKRTAESLRCTYAMHTPHRGVSHAPSTRKPPPRVQRKRHMSRDQRNDARPTYPPSCMIILSMWHVAAKASILTRQQLPS